MWAILLAACLANPPQTAVVEEVELIEEIHEYDQYTGQHRCVVYRFRDKSRHCQSLVTIESQCRAWVEATVARGADGWYYVAWEDGWNECLLGRDGKYKLVPMSVVRHVRARSYEVLHTTYDWEGAEYEIVGGNLRRGLRKPTGIKELVDVKGEGE